MAIIKSHTDLSQSKKLAEILPLESADNYYSWHDERYYVVNKDCPYPYSLKEKIPCWSLAALLDALPDELEDNHFLTLSKEGAEYCCCYEDINGNSFRHTFADNPVDACVAMVEKLNELTRALNKLNKKG